MQIPFERWQRAIPLRHSSRTYNNQPLAGDTRKEMTDFIEAINKQLEGVRAVFVAEGGDRVLRFIIGSYGVFKGVRSYLAFIADQRDAHYREKTGYLGEACVLEATAAGLATCWISGTFSPGVVAEQIDIRPDERVMAITPLGYELEQHRLVERLMKKAVGSQARKSLQELCPQGYSQDWPDWIKAALELARMAPSAANRQPWRFKVGEDRQSIKVLMDNSRNAGRKKLDCGIAMLHLEIGALNSGAKGEWEYLGKPAVADYTLG